jgi:hypothetical protein
MPSLPATIPSNQCIPRAKRPSKRLEGLNHFPPVAVQNRAGTAHFEFRLITVAEMFARCEDAETICLSSFSDRTGLGGGCLPAPNEDSPSLPSRLEKRLVPPNNRDLPPRKNTWVQTFSAYMKVGVPDIPLPLDHSALRSIVGRQRGSLN